MKRNKNLVELSRDHHHGLLLGWKVRQGLKLKASEKLIAEYVQYFTNAALVQHFKEEEVVLLKYLPDQDIYKQRTLQEHREFLSRVGSLDDPDKVSSANLLETADLLDRHIRFEERELFPYLEQALNESELAEVGAALDEIHKPFIEDFSNEFWKAPAH